MRFFERLRGRRGLALGVTGGLAFALLTTAGLTSAVAAGQITSADIKDGSVREWDIRNGDLDSTELEDLSVREWDIRNGELDSSEIEDGSVRERDLHEEVTEQLGGGGDAGPPAGSFDRNLDGTVDLPGDTDTRVMSLPVSGASLVFGHVTVSGGGEEENNAVCSLIAGGDPVAEANELLGTSPDAQKNASMTLVGYTPIDGEVHLNCRTGNGGFATDVTMTSVRVAAE